MFLVGMVASTSLTTLPVQTNAGVFTYHSNVCIDVTRSDGTHELIECENNPNFLHYDGKNLIMHELGTGASLGATNVIGLCNVTTGTSNVITCYGNNSAANGLGNTTGTFAQIFSGGAAVPGNWSISNQFTSTGDNLQVNGTILANGTALGSGTGGGIIFANNTFTTVTLNTNDQITIRWNISIA